MPITASTRARPTAPCPVPGARCTIWATIPPPRPTPRRAPRRSSTSTSINRDLGRLGELTPLDDLFGDLRAEFIRPAADRLDAVLVEARLGLGQGDEAPGGRRQLLDHRAGGRGRRDQGPPQRAFGAPGAFGPPRPVRKGVGRPGPGD